MTGSGRTTVHSRSVEWIEHDAATNDLAVKWKTGKVSIYSGVPTELAENVSKAWSVGNALTMMVKPNYPHRYADEPTPPTDR